MAKVWKCEEFKEEDSGVGHGREHMGRSICEFLNKKGIEPGAVMVIGYPEIDMLGKLFLHAILFYYQE